MDNSRIRTWFSFGFGNWWYRFLNLWTFSRNTTSQSKKLEQEYRIAFEALMASASPLSRAMGHWMEANTKTFGRYNTKAIKSKRSLSRGGIGGSSKVNREIIVLSLCNPISDDAVFIDHIGSKFGSIRYVRATCKGTDSAGVNTSTSNLPATNNTDNKIEVLRKATTRHECSLILNEVIITCKSEKLAETVQAQVDCKFDLVLLGPGCFWSDEFICSENKNALDNKKGDGAEFTLENWLLEAYELSKPQGCVLFCCKNLSCSPNTLGEGIEAAKILQTAIQRNHEMRQRVQKKLSECKIPFRIHPIESWLDIAEGIRGTPEGLAFLDRCFDTMEAFTKAESESPGSTKKLREKLELSATRASLRAMSTEEIVKPFEQGNQNLVNRNKDGTGDGSDNSLFIRIQGEIFYMYNIWDTNVNQCIEDELSIMNTDKALAANIKLKTEWDAMCWPEGPDGNFRNFGYECWLEGRRNWLKVEEPNVHMSERPPLAYEEIIEGLMNHQKYYELPHPVHLPDIIDIYTDIWDAQDSF